jgi:hypothetical protein
MNEMVYVLTVETLVFGALCTLLLAQRWDVFAWPADRTWPVFGSCLQLLLVYSAALQVVCCFLAGGHFVHIAPEIRDACARSAGRLSTAALLCAVYVFALSAMHETDRRACVLCQLWGTTCSQPESLFASWSYGVYLAVLLPGVVLQAGLLITAAGMCKLKDRWASRRMATANCALVLAYHANYSLRKNAGLLTLCGSGDRAPGSSKIVLSHRLLVFAVVLCSVDILGEIHTHMHRVRVARFAVLRALQLASVVGFNLLYDDESLPWRLLFAHVGVAAVLLLLDVLELHSFAKSLAREAAEPEAAREAPARETPAPETVLEMPRPLAAREQRSAFEVEPARRRKFVLTFNNKSRWPTAAETPAKKLS